MRYAVINGEEVVRYGRCQPQNLSTFEKNPGDIAIYTDADPENCWWDTVQEKLVPKQPHPAKYDNSGDTLVADGNASAVFSNIPAGSKVEVLTTDSSRLKETFVHGVESYTVSSSSPGGVTVIFSGVRYHPTVFEVYFEQAD